MNRSVVELVAAGVSAAAFLFLLLEATGYPGRSAYMPVAAAAIGAAMCALWALRSLRLLAAGQAERYPATRDDLTRFALILGLAVLYVVGFITIGFFTSTLVLLPVFAVALGYRRWRVIALTTLGFALVLWVVFRLLLSLPLPPEAVLTLIGA
jgi:hypothetical protein